MKQLLISIGLFSLVVLAGAQAMEPEAACSIKNQGAHCAPEKSKTDPTSKLFPREKPNSKVAKKRQPQGHRTLREKPSE